MFIRELERHRSSSLNVAEMSDDDREPLVVDWDELENRRWQSDG